MFAMPVNCPIWPEHSASLQSNGSVLAFYVQSSRAGGRYEFHLPDFGVELPDLEPKPAPTGDAMRDLTAVFLDTDNPEKIRYGKICQRMGAVLRQYEDADSSRLFKVLLSHKIYESQNQIYTITPRALDEIVASIKKGGKNMPMEKRAESLAKYIAKNPPLPGGSEWCPIKHNAPEAMAASCSQDFGDLVKVAEWLAESGHIELNKDSRGEEIAVKVNPFMREFYKIPKIFVPGDDCFVAMPFSGAAEAWYVATELSVNRAGYRTVRIDRESYIGKVDLEIRKRVRKAKFVIADLTEQRQSVYYEAGFAEGLGLNVIFTCEQSEVDDDKVHFDLRNDKIIKWDKSRLLDGADNFASRLQKEIESIFGKGNYKPKE